MIFSQPIKSVMHLETTLDTHITFSFYLHQDCFCRIVTDTSMKMQIENPSRDSSSVLNANRKIIKVNLT